MVVSTLTDPQPTSNVEFTPGYAEFTCVPVNQVQVIKTKLPWEQLGALPEMMNTAVGEHLGVENSLF